MRRRPTWVAAEREARERRAVPLGDRALPDLLGRLAAGTLPPIIAAGLDVPDLVRPHLDAVLEELGKHTFAELSGAEILAAALASSTAIVIVPRRKVGIFLRELAIPRVTEELSRPVAAGRARVTLLGPGSAIHFAGIQLAQFSRGGSA